eukprot:CAMPEP_0180645936 /NCGR_PEP_ID=MMETSP1037_2-20121125/49299_1 /TAXON_ID=632150 /ORGANISM="Azadinium spinosum, Strain 3D9" /LENGTH=124 /DNA_ID=CAMNT_0022669915 /DNA_START=82 /DNA_END=453 /DNA_ORIENTATION=+
MPMSRSSARASLIAAAATSFNSSSRRASRRPVFIMAITTWESSSRNCSSPSVFTRSANISSIKARSRIICRTASRQPVETTQLPHSENSVSTAVCRTAARSDSSASTSRATRDTMEAMKRGVAS